MPSLLASSLQRLAPLLAPPPQWEQHYQEQEERWTRHDGLASSIALLALLAAALRIGANLSLPETAAHLVLAVVALAVVQGRSAFSSYTTWRNAAVAFLRLGFCMSTVLQKHALMVLEVEPSGASPSTLTAVLAVVSLLVGDHTALLAFLGIGWPLGTLSNALLQLLCVVLVAQHNGAICRSLFMQAVSAKQIEEMHGTLLQRSVRTVGWLPLPTEEQLLLGFAAPILYQTRQDVRAGLGYGARHDIAANDRLHHTFRWLNRWVSSATPLLVIVSSACVAVGASSALLLARGGK